jgi:hypothetical protein
MTIIENRIAELIQADVDGELAVADRAELSSAMENSAEVREFHGQLTRLAKLMAETPDLDPPWGLRRRIVDNITLPAQPQISRWFRPAFYGLAVAASVLIAVGITKMAPQTSQDMSSLVGTMASQRPDVSLSKPPISELVIDVDALKGKVRLKDLDPSWALEFELQSEDAVEIALDLDGTGLSFGGYADGDKNTSDNDFEVSEGKVRMTNYGSHQFVLFLRRVAEGSKGSQEIGITVNHQGETVYHGLLESRG